MVLAEGSLPWWDVVDLHAVVDRIQVWPGGWSQSDDNPASTINALPASLLFLEWFQWSGCSGSRWACPHPEAKTLLVGSLQAERETTFYHSVDVRKALANPHEEHYACRSTLAGLIAVPALNANIGSSPMICLFASNNDPANNRFLIIRREVTYHMTFNETRYVHSSCTLINFVSWNFLSFLS